MSAKVAPLAQGAEVCQVVQVVQRPRVARAPRSALLSGSAQGERTGQPAGRWRMNPALERLRPYPFERLHDLLAAQPAPPGLAAIDLSIGEPRHPTPAVLLEALTRALPTLAGYPATQGSAALRTAIAAWLMRRYNLPQVDPQTQVLPVNGSREALFSFAQAVIEPGTQALVVVPNPGYQVYEGAALLAGAQVLYLAVSAAGGYRPPWEEIAAAQWRAVRLVYVCTPANPSGHVMTLGQWRELFELAERHDFLIAADECYSEIYSADGPPPLGALQAAQLLGRSDFARLVSFSSLSKRSNAPGLRSGFVAGDAQALARFLRYRTYHGSAMNPAVQAASIAAWGDETHVQANRVWYTAKLRQAQPLLDPVLPTALPEAGFYLWARTPGADTAYAAALYGHSNVKVLPGSYLGREVGGHNPGAGYVRLALVPDLAQVLVAVERIADHARG